MDCFTGCFSGFLPASGAGDAPPKMMTSWLTGEQYDAATADPLRVHFDTQGFLHMKGFCSPAECESMVATMHGLAEGWDPAETKATFRTDEKQEQTQGKSDYFLSSSDKVHFFAEEGILEADGSLQAGMPRVDALNKVGHALHAEVEAFRTYTTSEKVTSLVRKIGMAKPVVPQSMYILKPPRIGGVVTSHQDSTFLYTEPRQSCVAVWLALHACDETNGCIWARPGSHVEPVRRQFARNPGFFSGEEPDAPKLVFETREASETAPFAPVRSDTRLGADRSGPRSACSA